MRPSKTLLTAIAAAILLVQSPRVFAASIGVNGTTLIFTADAGDDVITAAAAPGATDVLITSSAPVTILTLDCMPAGGSITCGRAGIDLLAILGGSGSDVLSAINVSNHLSVFLSGGDGDDILLGGDGDDILKGGSSDNVMLGGAGTNVCFGGPTDIMLECTLGNTEPPDPTLGASEVPEPATFMLVASGIGAFAAKRRRRRP